jgi:hypothetical protein
MKKVVLPGLVAGAVMLVIGLVVGYLCMLLFPQLKTAYENTSLFRSWEDPIMYLYFAYPFVTGLILAWVWNKVKKLFTGKAWAKRGGSFGLVYWVVVTIPGMLISYASFPLTLLMIATWTVSGLLEALCAGPILAAMNK